MKKWKPKLNGVYFYVVVSGCVRSTFFYNDLMDKMNLHFGNCFKTEAEAQKVLDKIRG